ncbi:MAG: four helix bundle protein [Prolixibacteraceae bacterium]|nr:four helix bundle protein [Prolixibacteraceae bacterium]
MNHAASFKDLKTYRLSREISKEIYTITKSFPQDERFSLTDQIRRSSRSVGAQIAESWAKRKYEKHFVSKLTDADGEQYETQHWLEICLECEYIEKDMFTELMEKCETLRKMIHNMIQKSDQFCKNC